MSLGNAVRESAQGLPLAPSDRATLALACAYADTIDAAPETIDTIGPKLLTCLESLLMTPRARAAVMKNAQDEHRPSSPLDELRARRNARRTG